MAAVTAVPVGIVAAVGRVVPVIIMAVSVAVLLAGGLRVRGKGGVPPQLGGWRELTRPR